MFNEVSENTNARRFTVHVDGGSKTYNGFNRDMTAWKLNHVVLVQNEDVVEVYAVDDPKKVSGLVAYLADSGNEHLHLIGHYARS